MSVLPIAQLGRKCNLFILHLDVRKGNSYTSPPGHEETPQLILENMSQDWSFFYNFNAYFRNAWDNTVDATELLKEIC